VAVKLRASQQQQQEIRLTPGTVTPPAEAADAGGDAKGTGVDWKETPKEHVFKADLPGLRKEDVKVQVEDGRMLSINRQRQKEEAQKVDEEGEAGGRRDREPREQEGLTEYEKKALVTPAVDALKEEVPAAAEEEAPEPPTEAGREVDETKQPVGSAAGGLKEKPRAEETEQQIPTADVVELRADVKVFDSSKVAVQPVEEANDKKIIVAVGSSTHRVRRPAYVEHGLDPEVAAALENSEGSEFDSAEELEDDFVVFANNNPEGATSGEFQGAESVGLRSSNLRLESSVVEGDEDEEEFSDEEDPNARGHADISQFDDGSEVQGGHKAVGSHCVMLKKITVGDSDDE
jgi:HSP20 family molecular chaperone IbpA